MVRAKHSRRKRPFCARRVKRNVWHGPEQRMSRSEASVMERSEKSDAGFCVSCSKMLITRGREPITHSRHPILMSVVEKPYTTQQASSKALALSRKDNAMAFVRRKGNAYYLVHNVRRGGKVRQLHLARLGDRARITDDVVREVSKKHPFVELNWRALRDHVSQQINLADPHSREVQKLMATLRTLHLD